MIICASPFFNELDFLEIKCRELAGLVDAHVIMEANLTYTGHPKPWNFQPERFAEFPIIYQRVELPVNNPDGTRMGSWPRENIHRKALFQIVKALRPEVVFYTDVDEIPRMNVLGRFRQMGVQTARLELDDLRYQVDRVDRTHRWINPYVTRHDPQAVQPPGRYNFAAAWPIMPDAGWHFCWQGGKQAVLDAVHAISHGSEECGIEFARKVEADERPDFDHLEPYPFDRLPDCVRADPKRYPVLFPS